MTVDAADAVQTERQRLINILRNEARLTREARGKFTRKTSPAAGILAVREDVLYEVLSIVQGEHREYPRPVPDIGTEPDALVTKHRDFQYIGIARTSVQSGEKVGVWLNEQGAVWALSQISGALTDTEVEV